MYAPQGSPAVFSSALASSVIVIAAGSWLLPPLGIPALVLRVHFPKLLSDALFFGRLLLGLVLSADLLLPCGQITVILLHKSRSVVVKPLECLHVGIPVFFQHPGQSIHPAVNFLLCFGNLLR